VAVVLVAVVVVTRMAVSVTHLVAVEVIHVIDVILWPRRFTASGMGSVVSVVFVVVIVDVPLEVLGPVKPWSCADEDAA
jgi:hypothetical protein